MQGLHRNITSFPETEASVSSQKKEKKQRNTHCEFSVKIYMKQNMKKHMSSGFWNTEEVYTWKPSKMQLLTNSHMPFSLYF